VVEQLRQSRRNCSFQLLLESCEFFGEIEHGPLLVALVEIRLIFLWKFVDVLDAVEGRRPQVNFIDALAEFFELWKENIAEIRGTSRNHMWILGEIVLTLKTFSVLCFIVIFAVDERGLQRV
jgi:hypothetical protein